MVVEQICKGVGKVGGGGGGGGGGSWVVGLKLVQLHLCSRGVVYTSKSI